MTMTIRNLFFKNKILDRIYMYVLRPMGYLLLLYPKDCYDIFREKGQYSYLKKYKDLHKGERCFIVGTGPSLTKADMDLIKNEKIFGVNALCLWTEYIQNINYFCIGDDVAYKKLYRLLPEDTFVSSQCLNSSYKGKNFQPLPVNRFSSFWPYSNKKFSIDASKKIYSFNSVIFLAIQLAIYMGFQKIYLLGVDCNYRSTKMYSVDHGIRHSGEYMKDAGEEMIENFKFVRTYLKEKHIDVSIYNATNGGMLEVFPRVKLKEVISK